MFSEVCLFGMPNSGKTTIFNLLTKSNEKVGNWHGVTLEEKKGQFEFNKNKLDVYDLPGVYSLYPVTLEEKISINKVLKTNNHQSRILYLKKLMCKYEREIKPFSDKQ